MAHDYSKVPGFEYMSRPDWIIGNRLFLIAAPAYLMMDERTVETTGTFHTGIRQVDNAIAKSEESGFRTILQMYEIWRQKGTIRLCNYVKDIEVIHGVIQDYFNLLEDFQDWHHSGDAALRIADNSTFNRLMLFAKELDGFARDVFKMAVARRGTEAVKVQELDVAMPMPFTAKRAETATASDYRPITDRIDYGRLKQRKRY